MAGLGPGVMFTSVFLEIDMHPTVASATGMYLTLFTTLATTINNIINQNLNLHYTLLISIVSILACIPGLYF